jgi:phosphoserine phosphatase
VVAVKLCLVSTSGGNGSISPEQLKQLLDVSRMLAVTSDLDELLHRIATSATQMLGCERASIFLHDAPRDQLWTKVALHSQEIRVPSGAGIVGHVFKSNQVLHVPRPYEDSRFNPEPDRRSGFVTRNLLTAPMVDVERNPVGVIQAVNKINSTFQDADHSLIQLLADQAGVAVQRYNLQQAALEALSLRREMELAKDVQQALIPENAPRISGIDAVGWSLPASITGGDCYDMWETADGRLGIFLGDATGHGIGPAMVVSQTRTLIRAMCSITTDPRKLLAAANSRLAEDLEFGQFVTAFVAFLAPSGRLDYCSAGHGPVLVRINPRRGLKILPVSAPPLGVVERFKADRVQPERLEPGGQLLVMSDGIFESFSAANEQFGELRVQKLLDENRRQSPAHVLQRLRDAVRAWQGREEPTDDQTVVIAARTPPPTTLRKR